MIRTGELIGRESEGALNLSYFINPWPDTTTSPTNELAGSTGGRMIAGPLRTDLYTRDGVCGMCHLEDNPYWRTKTDVLSCASGNCHTSGSHIAHLSAENGPHISCDICHDLDNMRDGEGDIIDPRLSGACDQCHHNGLGGAPNDNGFRAGWDDPGYDLNCAGCHKGRPKIDYVDDVYVHDPASTCTDCHSGHVAACHLDPDEHDGYCTADDTFDCASCHYTGDPLSVTPELQRKPVGMQTNGHKRLVSSKWIRQYDCYYCHSISVDAAWNLSDMHANGSKDVAMSSQWKIVGQGAPYFDPGAKVCYNTYCHSDGTTLTPVMRAYPWDGGHEDCNSCHGHDPDQENCSECHAADERHTWTPEKKWLSAMPMYANTGPGTANANSHFRHLFTQFSCDDCHVDTVVGACINCHGEGVPEGTMSEQAHIYADHHVNKTKTVAFKDGGSYNEIFKSCSSTKCHSGTDPVWGDSVSSSITCLECHGTTGADVDDFGEFNDVRARINLTQWATTGHGRPAASGNYDSGNPPAAFLGIGCWYCHDNQVLHRDDENPFRLRKHDQFANRFEKECVYCHMTGEDAECLNCHDNSESLAPQLADITGGVAINLPYTIAEPDHSGLSSGCDNTTCHVDDSTRHKSGAGLWTQDQKDDVENSYMLMGVCLKCHDDDSSGQCNSCHTAPPDDPGTPDVDESLKYSLGFDPGLPGTTLIQPQQAKASSFHFGYKHYIDYENSIATPLDAGTVSDNAATSLELTDTGKSWTADEWSGYSARMTGGENSDEIRKIESNTGHL